MGSLRRVQRARQGLTPDVGVRGGARGGEGVAGDPAGAGAMRRNAAGERNREVWRLNLATLRWVPIPALLVARDRHVSCAVRGALIVLGGNTDFGLTSSVEMLPEEGAFVKLPPLSCSEI